MRCYVLKLLRLLSVIWWYLLACIRFAIFIINPQCLSFDVIPVFMTQTDPHCPRGDLWDVSASSSDFFEWTEASVSNDTANWINLLPWQGSVAKQRLPTGAVSTLRGRSVPRCPGSQAHPLVCSRLFSNLDARAQVWHSPCSSRIWACVAICHWARNGFAAVFSFFWVLSWFQDTCVSDRLSLLVVWSFLGCFYWCCLHIGRHNSALDKLSI